MTNDIMDSILEILAHPIRRAVINILGSGVKPRGVSYTELLTDLQISTGKLNYHLRQLNGYLEKSDEFRYILTPLGNKAFETLELVKKSAAQEPELTKYLKPTIGRSNLSKAARSIDCILIIGVSVPIVFISKSLIDYLAAPSDWSYVIFLILALGIGVALLFWLIVLFKHIPELARKVEEKLYG